MNNSLQDVHQSINTQQKSSKWRKIISFFGPAYLISVGYMDPGNWATDLAGGSRYGYALIWVLVMSNIMALLLQSLSARLGIVRGRDLAQCNRETYPKGINYILWVLAEVAIAACDLAEVLGMAIGLQLLFGMDLIWGVIISYLDTILLLWLQRLGMRKMELFIISMIAIIGMCFIVEMSLAKPAIEGIASGLIPTIPDSTALYIAIGIIGATVMPHNLYLHSALVQTRKIGKDEASIKKAIKYNFWDSAIALNLALFVNAAILILAASTFHKEGMHDVGELQDAHKLLAPLLGTEWAPRLFAVALIAAGQSSTITGTLAGQIVMEGYLHLRISPILRRLITRSMAIIPAVIVILINGEEGVNELLIFSQVILSMQLAFAVIPLIHFVSDKRLMGSFAIGIKTKVFSWIVAIVITVLNLKLVYDAAMDGFQNNASLLVKMIIVTGIIFLIVMLYITTTYPLKASRKYKNGSIHKEFDFDKVVAATTFKRIALAVDYSAFDKKVLSLALSYAGKDVTFHIIHITESASTSMMLNEAEDSETKIDESMLLSYVSFFELKGLKASQHLGLHDRAKEIARICEEEKADLLIVGSHGHKGIADFIFGETVNKVRHLVNIPVLIAK